MKTTNIVALVFVFLFVSCEQDGAKPVIDFHELGFENSKTATVGDELHMDAEIEAENSIDRIELEIHPEGDEHKSSSVSRMNSGEWEFDTVYTEFSGLKNTVFHEHIEIPEDATPGEYHFHFAVIDMEGYQTVYEDEVTIQLPE